MTGVEPLPGSRVLDGNGCEWLRHDDLVSTWRPAEGEGDAVSWGDLLRLFGPVRELGEPIDDQTPDGEPVDAEVLPFEPLVTEIVVGDPRTESLVLTRHPLNEERDRWRVRGVAGAWEFRAADPGAAALFGVHLLAAYVAREDAIGAAVARFRGGVGAGFGVEGVTDVRDDEPPF